MLEVLRKYLDSLTGVTEMTRDRAERLVRDLQKRGEVRTRDISTAAQDLVDRSMRNRRELIGLIRKEIKQQISSVGVATKDDVEQLSRRVKALEGAKKGSSKKTSSAKRSSAKSSPKTSAKKTT